MNNYYFYEELRAAAVAPTATEDDLAALGAWFEQYGVDSWNGECWDAGDGLRLFPIVKWDDELDQGETVGYEFR